MPLLLPLEGLQARKAQTYVFAPALEVAELSAEVSNFSQGKYTVTLIPGDGRSLLNLNICNMNSTMSRYRPRN
jgi:hypothetical protein